DTRAPNELEPSREPGRRIDEVEGAEQNARGDDGTRVPERSRRGLERVAAKERLLEERDKCAEGDGREGPRHERFAQSELGLVPAEAGEDGGGSSDDQRAQREADREASRGRALHEANRGQ